MISLILTVFNKEALIGRVVAALLATCSPLVREYIVVLDGCTDGSEAAVAAAFAAAGGPPHGAALVWLRTPDVFEIRANNAGIKAASQPYAVLVQDDMLVVERGWDARLLAPLLRFRDVWAVTANSTGRLARVAPDTWAWTRFAQGPVGHALCGAAHGPPFPRHEFHVRQVVNRGPLLLDVARLAALGYPGGGFDEGLPGVIGCDDADACLRAFRDHGWRCGAFWVAWESDLAWGATRSGPNRGFVAAQEALNRAELVRRYGGLLAAYDHDEVRVLPDAAAPPDRVPGL